MINFIEGAIESAPALKPLMEGRSRDTISLKSGVDIVVRPASFRSTRGATCVAVICDEIAFFRLEGAAQPDTEIVRALRPSLLTTHGPLICISSPYARRGELWRAYNKHFGKDSNVLVAQAPSWLMNSTLDKAWIDEQFADDPIAANAEYGANFRTDVEQFVTIEAIEACISSGVYERLPLSELTYYGFVDPSGGSQDGMTLAISHREGDVALLDCIREVTPPFSPEAVVKEFVDVLRGYRVASVRGDRFAGEFSREPFKKLGIDYLVSQDSKSQIYQTLLPLLNSRRIDLLDDKRLVGQLLSLERRTARGGRDSIDHAPGHRDDRINAAAGALVLAGFRPVQQAPITIPFVHSVTRDFPSSDAFSRAIRDPTRPGHSFLLSA